MDRPHPRQGIDRGWGRDVQCTVVGDGPYCDLISTGCLLVNRTENEERVELGEGGGGICM